MADLERRALLGDKKAQEELTWQGIVLECGCGGFAELNYVECGQSADFDTGHGYIVKCEKCGMNSGYHRKPWDAVAIWNNRAEPPIGRCKDCRHLDNTGKHPVCWHTNMPLRTGEDFCSYYESKEN